jgi:hypothetical protein
MYVSRTRAEDLCPSVLDVPRTCVPRTCSVDSPAAGLARSAVDGCASGRAPPRRSIFPGGVKSGAKGTRTPRRLTADIGTELRKRQMRLSLKVRETTRRDLRERESC